VHCNQRELAFGVLSTAALADCEAGMSTNQYVNTALPVYEHPGFKVRPRSVGLKAHARLNLCAYVESLTYWGQLLGVAAQHHISD